jgi:hypothetical protein
VLSRDRTGERGYAIVLTALVLVPLLAMAALAVDVGAWYAEAAKQQKAADAASLGGVVYLPKGFAEAKAQAEAVALAHGYPSSQVTVTQLAREQLEVTINNTRAAQYLSKLFVDEVAITRTSSAEFVRPVPMGSPRNFLGTHQMFSPESGLREDFWAAVSGYCASKEQGDRINAISDANFDTDVFAGCQPGMPGHVVANMEHDPSGYFYAVEVPVDHAGSLHVQIFDAPYCWPSSSPDEPDGPGDTSGGFDITWRMRANDSINPEDGTVLKSVTLGAGTIGSGACRDNDTCTGGGCEITMADECASQADNGDWGACWHTFYTLTNPTSGVYYLQATPQAGYAEMQGTNQFALRVKDGSTFRPCSSDPHDTAVASSSRPPAKTDCPNVHAVANLGVFAPPVPDHSNPTAVFYLAEISAAHNGKTLHVTLWDAGEGNDTIELLDPNGDPVTARWTILCQNGNEPPCAGEQSPSGGYGPFTRSSLSVSDDCSGKPTCPQPGPHRLSASKYNDRAIRIEYALPGNIAAAYGGRTWWKVRYRDDGGDATDRTTWSVVVYGDPVRLIESR